MAAAFRSQRVIRFSEVDFARVLYYPRYFELFHETFEDWFNQALGTSYRELVEVERLGFPAVHAEADFCKPLRFGDHVEVELALHALGQRSATFDYRVDRDEQLAATGRVTVVALDLETGRSQPIPPKYRRLFQGDVEPS